MWEVCRKSYIHPAILDSAVLAFLQERLARELDRRKRAPRDLKEALRASLA